MREGGTKLWAQALVGVSLTLACGHVEQNDQPRSETPSAAGAPPAAAGGTPSVATPEPLLPWQIGNSWTYRINENGQLQTEKTTTVGPLELVGGQGPNSEVFANLVTTVEDNGELTESWQGPSPLEAQRIVRFREVDRYSNSPDIESESHYDPEKLRFDGTREHTRANAVWIEEYIETLLRPGVDTFTTNYRDRWTVEGDDETVSVPAGTFTGVVHLSKEGATEPKHYWYAPGVGKLKEAGTQTTHTEELVSYHLEP